MPVDRGLAEDLATGLVDLYAGVQDRLAVDIGRMLATGIDRPDWADRRLAALGTLRRHVETILAGLNTTARAEIEQALVLAYVRGGHAAVDEMGRLQLSRLERAALGSQVDGMRRLAELAARRRTSLAAAVNEVRLALPGVDAVQRLAFSLASQTQGTHLRVLRWSLDAYREVVARGSAETLLGTQTRLRTAQVVWEGLLSRGITGFVDRSGRGWELASYVEMATRSTTAQAAVQSHLDRLGSVGLDLVVVSDAPQECQKCRPWEGKILDRKGPGGRHTVQLEHATRDGHTVEVEIAGSVDEAIRAGLMHPNCRHSLSAFQAGVTRIPTNTEDPEGDKARQRQRAIEREIRKAKRVQEAAIDPAATKSAGAKVRALQTKMRDHLAANPDLRRKPGREQIGVAR